MGSESGKVRALLNDIGKRVESAGPSTPVEVLGLSGTPNAGDLANVVSQNLKLEKLLNIGQENQSKKKLL